MKQLRQMADLLRTLQDAETEAIAEGLIKAAGDSSSARNGMASPALPENHKPASANARTPGNSISER